MDEPTNPTLLTGLRGVFIKFGNSIKNDPDYFNEPYQPKKRINIFFQKNVTIYIFNTLHEYPNAVKGNQTPK